MFKVIRFDLSGVLFKIFSFLVIYKCNGIYNGRLIIKESLGKVSLFNAFRGFRFVQSWHCGRRKDLLIKEEEGKGGFT